MKLAMVVLLLCGAAFGQKTATNLSYLECYGQRMAIAATDPAKLRLLHFKSLNQAADTFINCAKRYPTSRLNRNDAVFFQSTGLFLENLIVQREEAVMKILIDALPPEKRKQLAPAIIRASDGK